MGGADIYGHIIRFVIAGAVVVCVPLIAERLSTRLAAMIMLVPAITILSLIETKRSLGDSSYREVVGQSWAGVVGVVVFLLFVWILNVMNAEPAVSLLGGTAAWVLAAAVMTQI